MMHSNPIYRLMCSVMVCLFGCGTSSETTPMTLESHGTVYGKLIVVADNIEFKDSTLLITTPLTNWDEQTVVNGKSLLFSKRIDVTAQVPMMLAVPLIGSPAYDKMFSTTELVLERGDVVVLAISADGTPLEPMTAAATSIEVLKSRIENTDHSP